MIVATALLSMAVVGLLSLITLTIGNVGRVQEYDRAAMLARSKMNELLTVEPLPLDARLEGVFDDGSGWEALATPEILPATPRPGATMLVRVTLTIWWRAGGERKTIELAGFRRMVILPEYRM